MEAGEGTQVKGEESCSGGLIPGVSGTKREVQDSKDRSPFSHPTADAILKPQLFPFLIAILGGKL